MTVNDVLPNTAPIALVYLARGIDGGLKAVEAFLKAYYAFPPDYPHDLIMVLKGWNESDEWRELIKLCMKNNFCIVEVSDEGYDWGAYMQVAPQLSHEWVCFLNTHSRPRIKGWLKALKGVADACGDGLGVVGTTASWESAASFRNTKSAVSLNIFSLKSLSSLSKAFLRCIRNLFFFKTFPNPHVRSNAFLVKKSIFLDFIKNKKIPASKFSALKLESGRSGFSSYLIKSGLRLLITGADGVAYTYQEWDKSGAFRTPGQPNLLIKDNQTEVYEQSVLAGKAFLELCSWGKIFSKPDNGIESN